MWPQLRVPIASANQTIINDGSVAGCATDASGETWRGSSDAFEIEMHCKVNRKGLSPFVGQAYAVAAITTSADSNMAPAKRNCNGSTAAKPDTTE